MTVDDAVGLGAKLVREHDDWRTLLSPGGLPFCVVDSGDREAPDPSTWPGGHRIRMVQVCIDAPADVHDDEVAFCGLLPGRWANSPAPEFAGKWHDDAGSPLQLLFQRLDEPSGPVRAHLDHGTDHLQHEVRRLLDLGAVEIGPGRGWHSPRPLGSGLLRHGELPRPDHLPRHRLGDGRTLHIRYTSEESLT